MLSAGIGSYLYYNEFLKNHIFKKQDFPVFLQKIFFKTSKKQETITENFNKSTDSLSIENDKNKKVCISDHISGYIPLFSLSFDGIYINNGKGLLFLLGIITYSNRKKLYLLFCHFKKYLSKDKNSKVTAEQIKKEIQEFSCNKISDESSQEIKPKKDTLSPLSNSDSESSISSGVEIINHPTESESNGKELKCPFTSWLADIDLSVFKK